MRLIAPWTAALVWTARLAADPAAGPILYPHAAGPASSAPAGGGFGGAATFVGALLAASVGAWLLWTRYRGKQRWTNHGERLLSVAETKSLGNRQYLVVAAYGDRRFLLGVCPTRIDMLAPLDGPNPPTP